MSINPWVSLFGSELTHNSSIDPPTSSLDQADCVGIYFSAHWCPPCRGFTPQLAEIYRNLKAAGKKFEVVFVSSDQDYEGFNAYFAEMPWLALPYDKRETKQELSSKFGVSGIPTLILLNPDGSTITQDGRSMVVSDPRGGWIPQAGRKSRPSTPEQPPARTDRWMDMASRKHPDITAVPTSITVRRTDGQAFEDDVGEYFHAPEDCNFDIFQKEGNSNALFFYVSARNPESKRGSWRTSRGPGNSADPHHPHLGSGCQYPGRHEYSKHYTDSRDSEWSMTFNFTAVSMDQRLEQDVNRVELGHTADALSTALRQLGVGDFEAQFREELGVSEVGDLKYVEAADLAEIGVKGVKQRRFMENMQSL